MSVARRTRIDLASPDCRLLVVGHHDVEHQPDGEDHDDRGQTDLDQQVALAVGGLQVVAGVLLGFRRHGSRVPAGSTPVRQLRLRWARSAEIDLAPSRSRCRRRAAKKLGNPCISEPNSRASTGYAGRAQRLRVLPALVAQRVEARGEQQRRRQPGQVVGQQRRHPRVGRDRRPSRPGTCRRQKSIS